MVLNGIFLEALLLVIATGVIAVPSLGGPRALVIALVFRLITILGDILFFLVAYLASLANSSKNPKQIHDI